ncbi:Hypothetical predicted protein [Cloeon dipterum]|uniref:Immunoglobulin I-set domain-containing protein n=1 Tax=Cloeon dipterum TaxID=197152 RepID=A0A8S1EEV3_9INSE|nr:Hypothetical predicted protein [Cloeon dipterum]
MAQAHQLQRMLAMVDAEALARLIADEPVVAGEGELCWTDRIEAGWVTASQNCFRLGADNEGTMLPKSSVSSTSSANYSEHILGGCGRDVGLFGCAAVHFSHGGALRTRSGDCRPVPSLADALKKPEPPNIQVTPATRAPPSDLKIALSFTGKQQKLIALSKLISFTDESSKRARECGCSARSPATRRPELTIKEKDDLRIVEISEVSVEDAGLYRVTLENDVGRVEASARLDVIGSNSDWRMTCWSAAVIEGSATAEEHGHISKGQTPGGPAEDHRRDPDKAGRKAEGAGGAAAVAGQAQLFAVDRLEADKQQLQQRLLEVDEKLEKWVKTLVEQLSRERVALEVGLTLARLNVLAAFLAALLRRPHLLASFSAANHSSLFELLDQSRSLYASALAVSAAPDDSLLDHIHKFLDAPQHFILEMANLVGAYDDGFERGERGGGL